MDQPASVSTDLPPAADGFAVQLRFELEQADVPLGRLQAVQEGAVLPLGDQEGRLTVRIIVGSRAIATGQIVSIGESYGVLIESILREG